MLLFIKLNKISIYSYITIINQNNFFSISRYSTVVVGAFDLKKLHNNTKTHQINKVIAHPRYNEDYQMHNDLALIKIEDTIKFSESVRPIKLPPLDLNVDGIPVVASGWGRLEFVCIFN